jgi:hypothetical protein
MADVKVRDTGRPDSSNAHTSTARWVLSALPWGPIAIVAAVLIVLHDIAFRGMLPSGNVDLMTFFLPNHCLIGKSLAAGHMPAWNPYAMGGAPFIGDPLAGWFALPPMLLNATLSCTRALSLLVLFHPLLAGVSTYAFLRSEDAGKTAATTAGLVMALSMSASRYLTGLHFASMVAWPLAVLACASRLFRAPRWSGRLAWTFLTALAFGQAAAMFLSVGSIISVLVLGAFIAYRVPSAVRSGKLTWKACAAMLALLAASMIVVNLAYFWPVLDYRPRTNLALGYEGMREATRELTGDSRSATVGWANSPEWILRMATTPGTYYGALPLIASFAALATRRRWAAATFLGVGVLCYLLSVESVAESLAPRLEGSTLGEFYLHRPERMGYGALVALGLLAGLGLQAVLESRSIWKRAWLLAPGIAVWGLLPWWLGAGPSMTPFLLAGTAGIIAVLVATRIPVAGVTLVAVVSIELVVTALNGQASGSSHTVLDPPNPPHPFHSLAEPALELDAYVSRGAGLAERMTSQAPARIARDSNSPFKLSRATPPWGLNGIEEALAYNSVQPIRFWHYTRALTDRWMIYNRGAFRDLTPQVRDVLQVRWVATRRAARYRDLHELQRFGGTTVYEDPEPAPRGEFFASWDVIRDEDASLATVGDVEFDSRRTLVLGAEPGIPPDAESGMGTPARFHWTSDTSARVEVDAASDGVVLIRNSYDPNWRAEVDGEPAEVIVADHWLQGVVVPEGASTIELTYIDASIAYGLTASIAASLLLLGGALLMRRRERRFPGHVPGLRPVSDPSSA